MSSSHPVALVTGGSRGIGASIVEKLARDGFHVLINYAANAHKAEELAERLKAEGFQADALGFDVAQSAAVDQAFAQIQTRFGRLDVLVNNAGITIDGLLLRLKDEDLDRTLNVDLKGAIFCTRAASKLMMKARQGSIIHISSVIGEMGNAGQSAYSAAKAGLIGFSKSVAKELASRNIRSNVITPGYIQTEMTGALTEAQKESILRTVPLGFLGEPSDVANAVSFLASAGSRYVTGQVLGINGGMYV